MIFFSNEASDTCFTRLVYEMKTERKHLNTDNLPPSPWFGSKSTDYQHETTLELEHPEEDHLKTEDTLLGIV